MRCASTLPIKSDEIFAGPLETMGQLNFGSDTATALQVVGLVGFAVFSLLSFPLLIAWELLGLGLHECGLYFEVRCEDDPNTAAKIDGLLAWSPSANNTNLEGSAVGDGVHWYFGGPCLCVRTTGIQGKVSYKIVTLTKANVHNFYNQVHGIEPGTMPYYRIEAVTEHFQTRHTPVVCVNRELPDCNRPNQVRAAEEIIAAYNEHTLSRALKYLVCGPSGCGKSYLATLIQKKLNDCDVFPKLVRNFDLTEEGLTLSAVSNLASKRNPMILLIDEIDVALKRSVANVDSRGHCIAENLGSFNAFMDQLESTAYTIAIFTTNARPDSLRETYKSQLRQGRIDRVIDWHEPELRN